jgi:hypothetical protein
MEVAADTMPTVEGAQSLGSVEEHFVGPCVFLGELCVHLLKGGPFEAWCGAKVRQTDPNGTITANADVGTYRECGGAYGIGDITVLVEAPFTPAVAAKPLSVSTETTMLGKPRDTVAHREGGLEVLESKHKFRPDVPLPRGTSAPSGHKEVIKRDNSGGIEAMWIGEGHPHGEARKLLDEPHPVLPAPTGEPGVPCSGC